MSRFILNRAALQIRNVLGVLRLALVVVGKLPAANELYFGAVALCPPHTCNVHRGRRCCVDGTARRARRSGLLSSAATPAAASAALAALGLCVCRDEKRGDKNRADPPKGARYRNRRASLGRARAVHRFFLRMRSDDRTTGDTI